RQSRRKGAVDDLVPGVWVAPVECRAARPLLGLHLDLVLLSDVCRWAVEQRTSARRLRAVGTRTHIFFEVRGGGTAYSDDREEGHEGDGELHAHRSISPPAASVLGGRPRQKHRLVNPREMTVSSDRHRFATVSRASKSSTNYSSEPKMR